MSEQVQRVEDLPEDLRAALDISHEHPMAELEWVEHVFAVANAGPCRGCGYSVDVAGEQTAPGRWLCGDCLRLDAHTRRP
ncbi:hypothetical protein CLV92_12021 [Kineococcus xinjiangensis]|uniref:Uncharacterized protein n=1 Tax=Kineococcus xinjiangensis TaxID=512762 RepID=A0A2S6ICE9_9ACTN|nr:hypothetical protein [Kineococcus xinjiangensis]PPK91902.1 hypothetical protein CLV92_12021 [Kineococcus xinjiangensis]